MSRENFRPLPAGSGPETLTGYAFAPRPVVSVAIDGATERFPVHRIYCVGRNYTEHAREMGGSGEREPPFFFSKPADAIVESGAVVPYPARTANFHHEVELVAALNGGGVNIPADRALEYVFGYAVGIDLTRRDLQSLAKDAGRPWDTSKGFDRSAVIGPIRRAVNAPLTRGKIWLAVNGAQRQQGDIAEMIWSVREIIAELSTLFELAAGDLIYTGTPAGVGPLKRGDRVTAGIDGVGSLTLAVE